MNAEILIGLKDNIKYEYQIILCKPNREELMFLKYDNLNYVANFRAYNQLNFTISKFLAFYDGTNILNPAWNYLIPDYLIFLKILNDNNIIYQEYFILENPNISGGESLSATFQASSFEKHDFNNKTLEGIKDKVMQIYSPTNEVDSAGIPKGILNYILDYKLYGTWKLGYIDQDLLQVERILTFTGQTLTNCISTLEESFRAIIIFDNVNMEINVYANVVGVLGENTGVVITDKEYIQDIKYTEDVNGIKTRLFMNGKNNAVITRYNPTGERYVDDFSFYMNTDYMSQSLIDALNAYNDLVESKRGLHQAYVNMLDEDPTNETALNGIAQLAKDLLWQNNFTQEQIKELTPFVKEEVRTISEISDQEQLYEYALSYLKTISYVPIQITITAKNIYSLPKYSFIWNRLTKVGDFANIYDKSLDIEYKELRMISYTHNPVSDSLSFEFSNKNESIKDTWQDFIFRDTVSNAAQNVYVERDDWSLYSQDRESLDDSLKEIYEEVNNINNVPVNYIFNNGKNRIQIANNNIGILITRIEGSVETPVFYIDNNGYPQIINS